MIGMPHEQNQFKPDAGVSLIELLIVLAIIVAAYALAVPGVRRTTANTELSAIVQDLTNQLRLTRASAIARDRNVAVAFATVEKTFTSELDGRVHALAADVAIALTTARELSRPGEEGKIVFFPDGSSSGGTIQLQRGGRRIVIGVDWLTGYAHSEETP